jgi:hypothetical protein
MSDVYGNDARNLSLMGIFKNSSKKEENKRQWKVLDVVEFSWNVFREIKRPLRSFITDVFIRSSKSLSGPPIWRKKRKIQKGEREPTECAIEIEKKKKKWFVDQKLMVDLNFQLAVRLSWSTKLFTRSSTFFFLFLIFLSFLSWCNQVTLQWISF